MEAKDAIKKIIGRMDTCFLNDEPYPSDLSAALSALDKQVPRIPVLKHDISILHINNGDKPHEFKQVESDNFYCPMCGKFVGECIRTKVKTHIQRKKKYCEECGQRIEWGFDYEVI